MAAKPNLTELVFVMCQNEILSSEEQALLQRLVLKDDPVSSACACQIKHKQIICIFIFKFLKPKAITVWVVFCLNDVLLLQVLTAFFSRDELTTFFADFTLTCLFNNFSLAFEAALVILAVMKFSVPHAHYVFVSSNHPYSWQVENDLEIQDSRATALLCCLSDHVIYQLKVLFCLGIIRRLT